MMAASIKIGRALAALLVDNLPAYFGSAEEAAGVKLPRMDLRHPDRLSRSDGLALHNWLVGQRDLRAAHGDSRHPDHHLVRGLFALANHFIHDHPQGPDGEPLPWAEPLSPALAGLIAGTREKIGALDLTPAEARDMIAWVQMDREHAAALYDRKNPDHAEILKEWQDLHEHAASDPAAATPSTATAPIGATPAAGAHQARIAELKAHPAYLDGRHPDHRQVVRELSDLLLAVPNPAAPSAAASGIAAAGASKPAVAPALTAQARIAELNQALRGNTRFGSSERQQMVAELGELLGVNGADNTAPPAAAASRISAVAATPSPAASGAASSPASRIAELNEALRANRMTGSTERRAMLAELGELLGTGASGTEPPAGG